MLDNVCLIPDLRSMLINFRFNWLLIRGAEINHEPTKHVYSIDMLVSLKVYLSRS